MGRTVNVLGTEYTILVQTESENVKLNDANGLCEQYSKDIVIENPDAYKDDPMAVSKIEEFTNRVIRHEIIHAFLGESGLRDNSEWAQNEEMVGWIAIQFPKLFKAFHEVGCL